MLKTTLNSFNEQYSFKRKCMMKIMKKGLRQVQLVTVSVVLSILTAFFSCNGWGAPKVVPVSYWINIDFDPRTGNFIHPHIKTTRDDTQPAQDVTSYDTDDGTHHQTTIEVHNETPLAGGNYPIEIKTPRDAVTLTNKTAFDFCDYLECGTGFSQQHLGLKRTYSQFIFTLQNQNSSDRVEVKSSLIESQVGNGINAELGFNSDGVGSNNKCHSRGIRIEFPKIISNDPDKNCVAQTNRRSFNEKTHYIKGSMHFVFDYDNKLKDFFKDPNSWHI